MWLFFFVACPMEPQAFPIFPIFPIFSMFPIFPIFDVLAWAVVRVTVAARASKIGNTVLVFFIKAPKNTRVVEKIAVRDRHDSIQPLFRGPGGGFHGMVAVPPAPGFLGAAVRVRT